MLRRAAVAGSWYSADPARLAAEVDRYVSSAVVEPPAESPRAVIVPHAGLMYSGPVAAFAYRAVRDRGYAAAVLVGPSHFIPFRGVSLWPSGQWETPYGPVRVDADMAESLRLECHDIVDVPSAHAREHSLEMQLPFLAHLLPGVPIVPLVMGHQTRQTAFSLGNALAYVIARLEAHQNVLLIASTDLSHYENAGVASQLDAVMIQRAEALDPEGLMAALEHEPRHACGGGPMVSVLLAARQLGATRARVLRYADSGDVSGDKSSVVGYMACVIE